MNTPTEYFGPHAKRWTNPRTGVTLSLSPRDYHQLVAEEKETIEAAAVEYKESLIREEESSPIPAEMAAHYDAIVYGATRGGIKYPGTLIPTKDAEALILSGGWSTPADQSYEMNHADPDLAEADEDQRPLQPSEGLPTAARRGGIKYPSMDDYRKTTEAEARILNEASPMPRGTLRFLSLSEDDTLGLIRPVGASEHATSKAVPQWPAARHFKRRRFGRIAAALVLVYIIAVIGVAAVVGVIS